MVSTKKEIFYTAATMVLQLLIEPGLHAMPRSIWLASSYETQIPTRSPYRATSTGFRNICIDFTFFRTWSKGSSMVAPTSTWPAMTVPVITVPFPLIWKQWSIANSNLSFLAIFRSGSSILNKIEFIKFSIPYGPLSPFLPLFPSFKGFGAAVTGIMGKLNPNLVFEKLFLSFLIDF